jgi:hypothetical protein
LEIESFERLIDFFERENADAEETVLPFNVIAGKLSGVTDFNLVEKVYEYWKDARGRLGGKRGLLKKYWRAPDQTNNDPRVIFRRLKDEKRSLRRNRKYDDDYLQKVNYASEMVDGVV